MKRLQPDQRACLCGKVKGKTVETEKSEFSGPGCLIDMTSQSFLDAVRSYKNNPLREPQPSFHVAFLSEAARTVKRLG